MSDEDRNLGKNEALPLLLPKPEKTFDKSDTNPSFPSTLSEAEVKPVKPLKRIWPYWFAAGFIVLAGGQGYLFVRQQTNQQVYQADKTTLAVLQVEVSDLRTNAAKTSPIADLITTQAQLAQKQAIMAAQLDAVEKQVTTDHGALAALQINATEISQLTARMARLNALATARMALAAGQPLGVIPNAPAALATFADTAPPTLLYLKETFPEVARHAEAASLANADQTHFWSKVKLRLEGLITIANGQRVIFGPPAAAALNRMRAALANDDLASAITAASALNAPTQAAMASWLTPARQLLAAQQALVDMARQGT